MAEIRRDPTNEERELEQRLRDDSGRDPTARRGEIEEGGSISDADVGKDEIEQKAIGGYGGDNGEAVRTGNQKPLSDNSGEARREPEGEA